MSTPAVYRFMPWSRRGLVAELRDSAGAAAGPLPARGAIKLDVKLTEGLGETSNSTAIAGPGDIVGIDPGSIVRTTPRPNASSVEPNYLVAVDFDEPDFPWLMTPAAANAHGQLRPWLALVVVEDRPGVSVSIPAGAPLPQLRIESGASRELPDLADSWAWAHTQLLVEEGSGAEAAAQLASDPDGHVSRLMCPRRLKPNVRWLACLVPAFDAGVLRGLGQVPAAETIAPAWTDQDSITLPLYFHWPFGTGPEGDFESLARRLKPFVVESEDGVPTVGTVKMHIGAAGGPVDLAEGHPKRIVQMDGALRALQQEDGELSEIPPDLRTPLKKVLNDIADPSGTDPDDGAVGPPLYGSWAANRFSLNGAASGWFDELNLDPRARVAAGLGAEAVRAEQEDLMTVCWEQVGSIVEANALLSRARLSVEASTSFHSRSVALLSPERLLTFAAPLSNRTPFRTGTVRAAIDPTSLPETAIDPGLRRLTAPTSRFVRKTARLAGPAANKLGERLVSKLADGTESVDPTKFVPSGVSPPLDRDPRPVAGGMIDLSPVGLPVRRSADELRGLTNAIETVRSKPLPAPAARAQFRPDLRTTGLVTGRHLRALESFIGVAGETLPRRTDGIGELLSAAAAQPLPSAFLLELEPLGEHGRGRLRIDATDVNRRSEIVTRGSSTEAPRVLGRFEGVGNAASLARLPQGTLGRGRRVVVRPGPVAGEVVVSDGDPVADPGTTRPTTTVPPLVLDHAVLNRFERAGELLGDVSAVAEATPRSTVVPFALRQAASALMQRCAPSSAHVARIGTMVRFGAVTLSDLFGGGKVDGLSPSPLGDRIMTYPVLPEPAYRMLARYDRDRVVPGVDAIPTDSVTLLETNPRFVAAYLAGVNHEINRELLWRSFPTDQRGTPMRMFWDRVDGALDIPPMHTWTAAGNSLATQAGGESNLVLLVRGELFRLYPNTVVLAIAASAPDTPSTDDADIRRPIFSGYLEPDIAYFGFDLVDDDLIAGNGWFFALQEQVTEPRFGLDETIDPLRGTAPTAWRETSWLDTPVPPGDTFTVENLHTVANAHSLAPVPDNGADTADALFQNPVQVLVHARNLARLEEI